MVLVTTLNAKILHFSCLHNIDLRQVTLTKVIGSTADISETFSVSDVGFNPEIYVGEEVTKGGLRVKRDEHGKPIGPVFEINQ